METATKGAKPIPYGVSGSPLVVGDRVIVTRPSVNGKSVAAYEVTTGKLLWEGGKGEAAYSSPSLLSLAGEEQVVIFGAENIVGLDPATGALRWSFPWTNNEKNNCSQPIPIPGQPDRLFVSTGYGKGSVLLAIERSQDGSIVPRPLWESKQMKNKFSSSFIVDEVVYGLDDGILAAINLSSGEKLWKKDRIGHGQLLLVGGKILAITESGDLQLIAINPKGSTRVGILPGSRRKDVEPHGLGYTLLVNSQRSRGSLLSVGDRTEERIEEPFEGQDKPVNSPRSPLAVLYVEFFERLAGHRARSPNSAIKKIHPKMTTQPTHGSLSWGTRVERESSTLGIKESANKSPDESVPMLPAKAPSPIIHANK